MRSFGGRTRAARREPTPGKKQVKQNGKGWLEVVKRMATTSGISSASVSDRHRNTCDADTRIWQLCCSQQQNEACPGSAGTGLPR